MRIDEINTRLAAIQTEMDTAEGEALTALEREVDDLIAERTQIQNDIQTRQQLRAKFDNIPPLSAKIGEFLFDFFEILWYNIYTKIRKGNKRL